MMEQIKCLLDLQKAMSEAKRLDDEKQRIPLEAADLKDLFEEKKALYLAAEEEFKALKALRLEKEREIEEEQDKVEKAKAKLMSIKTNKEYYAMLKEIDGTKRINTAREDDLLSLLSRYEESEKLLAVAKTELDAVEGEYREAMTGIEARMSSFDAEIEKILARKREIASKLDKGLVSRFETIFQRREGVAVAAAINYSCVGCNMNISPQLFNMLQREDRIHTCPNCNRILYFDPQADEAAG